MFQDLHAVSPIERARQFIHRRQAVQPLIRPVQFALQIHDALAVRIRAINSSISNSLSRKSSAPVSSPITTLSRSGRPVIRR